MSSRRTRQLIASLMFSAAGAAAAAPVTFNVSPLGFTPGAGYGVDGNEAGGTLLDVRFAAAPGLQNFSLSGGQSASFTFGSATLNESFINANETDGLGVAAVFVFADPLSGLRQVTAMGTAVVGLVADLGVDLTLDWSPLQVSFASGGLFQIDIGTIRFRQNGQVRGIDATITLLSEPTAHAVPEPGSLALAGLALAGLGMVGAGRARRRADRRR